MIKKLLWMSIAVLVAACTFYIIDGQGLNQTPTPIGGTPTFCADCGDVIGATATRTQPATPPGDWVTVVATQYTSTPTKVVTPTPTVVPPTATMTKTNVPATATKTPTATVTPLSTPTVTSTPSFAVQIGSPVYMTNFVHQDLGCNWEGIAGHVFNRSGTPIRNYIIKVIGTYNGQEINLIGVTNMTAGVPYGFKSYEIVLGDKPVNSAGLLTIQLFDPNGVSVTDPIQITTYNSCTQNLIIMNFKKQ